MRLTGDDGDVVSSRCSVAICAKIERSVVGGYSSLNLKYHPLISDWPVARNSKIRASRVVFYFFEQLGNGDNRDVLPFAHVQQLGQPEEFSIVSDNLTDNGDGFQACHVHEFDCCFGVTSSFFDASGSSLEGNNVAGTNQ